MSGVIALFPAVFTSLILILTPRIGGPATAAVLANGQWGLIGFGTAIVVLHLAALPLGRARWRWPRARNMRRLESRAVASTADPASGLFRRLDLSA